MSETGWVCENCGEVATGDMCVHCGRSRPFVESDSPSPGSYGRILGLPGTSSGARLYCAFYLGMAFVVAVATLVARLMYGR